MKILILFNGPLYPMIGSSQVRVFNQIKYLSINNHVDFANVNNYASSIEITLNNISPYIQSYYPFKGISFGKKKFVRAILLALRKIIYYLSNQSMEEIGLRFINFRGKIFHIIKEGDYDAVIMHYWYCAYVLKNIPQSVIKIIDTHGVIEEEIELFRRGYYKNYYKYKFKLVHYLKKQIDCFHKCDYIVVNSTKQADIINSSISDANIIIVENGMDLDEFLQYKCSVDYDSLLFYGSLSNSFNKPALERILDKIYPGILALDSDAKLVIVGSNPPKELLKNYNYPLLTVTGYVDDIKPFIGKCAVMLLPLERGSGFRGRTVEVMALGVPIVGTRNGFLCTDIQDGIQGYYAETDEEIIQKAYMIMKNPDLRKQMSDECRKFVKNKYSLEATYGKLEQEIKNLYYSKHK